MSAALSLLKAMWHWHLSTLHPQIRKALQIALSQTLHAATQHLCAVIQIPLSLTLQAQR